MVWKSYPSHKVGRLQNFLREKQGNTRCRIVGNIRSFEDSLEGKSLGKLVELRSSQIRKLLLSSSKVLKVIQAKH